MNSEPALMGWKAIARFLGVSECKAKSWRSELASLDIIFQLREGNPSRRYVCAWPRILRRWAEKKIERQRAATHWNRLWEAKEIIAACSPWKEE